MKLEYPLIYTILAHLETSDTWFVEEMQLVQHQHSTTDLLGTYA